jgi:hypothetical protein
MTDAHLCTEVLHTLRVFSFSPVGSGDFESFLKQDLGNPAHPDSADPDKMKFLD